MSAEESQRFDRAQSFLWTVRCHLHYLAGRAEERLTFDLQAEIGAAAWATPTDPKSRGVERFMKDYFLVAKDVGDLTRIFCAILEADQKRKRRLSWLRWGAGRRALGGFVLDGERLTIPAEDFFKKDPVGAAAALSCRPGARARHPPARFAGGDAIVAAGRRGCARIPRPIACSSTS